MVAQPSWLPTRLMRMTALRFAFLARFVSGPLSHGANDVLARHRNQHCVCSFTALSGGLATHGIKGPDENDGNPVSKDVLQYWFPLTKLLKTKTSRFVNLRSRSCAHLKGGVAMVYGTPPFSFGVKGRGKPVLQYVFPRVNSLKTIRGKSYRVPFALICSLTHVLNGD